VSRYDYGWPRYISAAEHRADAKKQVEKLRKKGMEIEPVEIEGRKIARTFWGSGWCKHLEAFSDYANRLPRGRSYVRNGMVCHLKLSESVIEAMVCGTSIYNVEITVDKLPEKKWYQLKQQCAGQIGSLLELLQGKLSRELMTVVTDRNNGLFPLPKEISFSCDCPDWATMCKHVAAVLYGVGKRLDEQPELLFLLRGVNVDELITAGANDLISTADGEKPKTRRVSDNMIGDIFGIDMDIDENIEADHTAKRHKIESKARVTDKTQGKISCQEGAKEHELITRIDSGKVRGKAIRNLRTSSKMTITQFSDLLGVNPATIYNWEKSRSCLKLQQRTRQALIDYIKGHM